MDELITVITTKPVNEFGRKYIAKKACFAIRSDQLNDVTRREIEDYFMPFNKDGFSAQEMQNTRFVIIDEYQLKVNIFPPKSGYYRLRNNNFVHPQAFGATGDLLYCIVIKE